MKNSKKNLFPDYVIPISVLSSTKILASKKKKKYSVNDFKANFNLYEYFFKKKSVTVQYIKEEKKVLKIITRKPLPIINCAVNVVYSFYFDFNRDKLQKEMSLVKYQDLYLQLFRFKLDGFYYLTPLEDYSQYNLYKNSAYNEHFMLELIINLSKKYIKPKTIIHCKILKS